jgi:uncharacterized protein (TIGR03067 family)
MTKKEREQLAKLRQKPCKRCGSNGPFKGKADVGIYELEEGRLRVCWVTDAESKAQR